MAVDAFRGTFPYARTDWDRPNTTQTASWTSTITNKLVNEFSFTYSLDEVFINVFRGTDLFQRSKYGINYPYIFPENKEIPDKIPTITIANFTEIDGGPYPVVVARADLHLQQRDDLSQGPPHVQGRRRRSSTRARTTSTRSTCSRFPGSTNNQNGRFQFTNDAAGANSTGIGIANAALGLFTSYAEIGQRALHQVARRSATDLFVQDSWRPTSNLTVEGGVRWAYWPPWYSLTNNIATFDPAALQHQPTRRSSTRRPAGSSSGPRYNGVVLPGDGFTGDGERPGGRTTIPRSTRCSSARRAASPRPTTNVFEPRLGDGLLASNDKTIVKVSAGVFHNRVTVNDSMFLGGNPPFQPQVGVSNGSADNPGGVGGAGSLPFGMTAIDREFKHPTAYMWSAGVQREIPLSFILDVDLRRPARTATCSASATSTSCSPARCRPIPASTSRRCGRTRATASSVCRRTPATRSTTACRSAPIAATRTASSSALAYTLGHSQDNASGKRDVLFNNYDDSGFWGNSSFDRRHVFNFYYIYDLPFYRDQTGIVGKVLGGWQISGATFMRSGTPLWVTEGADIAGTGDTFAQPVEPERRSEGRRERGVLGGRRRRPELLVQPDRVLASGRRHVRQRRRGTTSTTPASTSGTSRCSRT